MRSKQVLITPFGEATEDVKSFAVRLHPLDVGFDLRELDSIVQVKHVDTLCVSAPNENGDRVVITGSAHQVCTELDSLGFKVELQLNGPWARVTFNNQGALLEIRDPNHGNGVLREAPRYQYRGVGLVVLARRHLPSVSVGDRWLGDIDEPWWEPLMTTPPEGPIREFWEHEVASIPLHLYEFYAKQGVGHVVAWTPNGREVRRCDEGVDVQPKGDNYWVKCADLSEAQSAYWGW